MRALPTRAAALLVAAALATPGAAQPASYTLFGQPGISYHGGAVTLSVVGMPKLGRSFSLAVLSPTSCQGPSFENAFAIAMGVSNQSWAGTPLPLDVTGWQLPSPGGLVTFSGRIYVSFDLVVPATGYIPRACGKSIEIDVPANIALLGAVFYNQGLELGGPIHQPYTWILGLTQGGRGVIGF